MKLDREFILDFAYKYFSIVQHGVNNIYFINTSRICNEDLLYLHGFQRYIIFPPSLNQLISFYLTNGISFIDYLKKIVSIYKNNYEIYVLLNKHLYKKVSTILDIVHNLVNLFNLFTNIYDNVNVDSCEKSMYEKVLKCLEIVRYVYKSSSTSRNLFGRELGADTFWVVSFSRCDEFIQNKFMNFESLNPILVIDTPYVLHRTKLTKYNIYSTHVCDNLYNINSNRKVIEFCIEDSLICRKVLTKIQNEVSIDDLIRYLTTLKTFEKLI